MTPSPAWQSLSLGSRLRPTTSSWVYSGQTKERLSERSIHHLIRRISLSTDAQHPCSAHLSTHPVCLSRPFCHRDVYTLLSILREAPVDADLILVNQDLAGFFTSIDQERLIRSWFMLLDFLRPKMNVCDDEVFSGYPEKSNNPGDIIKASTFPRLNVTRKIVIKHVPDLIKSALDMQTLPLAIDVSVNVEGVLWAALSHQHYA